MHYVFSNICLFSYWTKHAPKRKNVIAHCDCRTMENEGEALTGHWTPNLYRLLQN